MRIPILQLSAYLERTLAAASILGILAGTAGAEPILAQFGVSANDQSMDRREALFPARAVFKERLSAEEVQEVVIGAEEGVEFHRDQVLLPLLRDDDSSGRPVYPSFEILLRLVAALEEASRDERLPSAVGAPLQAEPASGIQQ